MGNALSCLRVGILQRLVTLMHTRRHALCLANLIGGDKTTIEDLEN